MHAIAIHPAGKAWMFGAARTDLSEAAARWAHGPSAGLAGVVLNCRLHGTSPVPLMRADARCKVPSTTQVVF